MVPMSAPTTNRAGTRRIDHCVLPVADLATARARLTRLGFTVAPDGHHPFGTSNVCVYFSDDTFLEPLAIVDSTQADAAVKAGNVFVARDRAFRAANGGEGFSALVFKTQDADDDHGVFVANGVSAGDMLSFSRPFVDVDGNSGTASFKLAFAAEPGERATHFFTCQRIGVPKLDRSALERHENGVLGIKAILAEAGDAEAARAFLEEVAPTPAGTVQIVPGQPGTGIRLTGIVLSVPDRARVQALFESAGIGYTRSANRLEVPPAPGQGFHFAFEER
jgi:hypothetical protein